MKSISPNIYKRDSTGGVRTWNYEVDGAQWRTTAGGPGRKPVTSGWTVCKGKQGRSDEQQALAEATSAETQKLDREYRRTEVELDAVPKSPMLAKSYEADKIVFPVFCQPKLDGIRALISEHGAFSRDYQPHLNVDHILERIAPAFKGWPGIVFDGELYNHDFKDDFGRISSIVRKQAPTPAQRFEAEQYLQFHIYDIADDSLTTGDRQALLNTIKREMLEVEHHTGPLVFVDTHKVTTAEELDQHYGDFLQAGYEGQMVRLNTMYEFDKRSKSLLKRKEFITAEFKLLRVEEGQGNWAGYAKRVVFQLADGRECGAGIRGTQAQMRQLLSDCSAQAWPAPQSVVTIRHFTPTPDGMPRFPVATDFHMQGRMD